MNAGLGDNGIGGGVSVFKESSDDICFPSFALSSSIKFGFAIEDNGIAGDPCLSCWKHFNKLKLKKANYLILLQI